MNNLHRTLCNATVINQFKTRHPSERGRNHSFITHKHVTLDQYTEKTSIFFINGDFLYVCVFSKTFLYVMGVLKFILGGVGDSVDQPLGNS